MKEIFDIFSKEKETANPKSENQTEITIDTREKQSLIASYLIEKHQSIKFEKLDIADYLIGNTAIERKTFSDFISSMINKRLFQQLNEIKKYPKHILIIENLNNKYSESGINENAVKGMILSVLLDYQIPIIFTKNEEDTANFLILLAKRQNKDKREISMRPTKSNQTLEEQKRFILEGFPGIGPSLSKELLNNFKSLRNVFNASDEELKQIKDFHENKVRKFKELLY